MFTLIVTALFLLNPQDSTKTDSLKTKTLDEIVINCIRGNRIAPISETTLQYKELEHNYGGQELPAFLAKTPSTTWYSESGNYNGYSYMRIRGIDQTRINFTLNGVPLNEPEDQGAYFSNYPDVINSIKSLQIQRGVGTSTNGATSFGGSVNMESPLLNEPAKSEFQITYGSFNTYRISSEMSTGVINKKFSFYGRYSEVGSDGFRHHSGTQGQSFFFNGGFFNEKNMIKITSFIGRSKNQMSYIAASESDLKFDYKTNYLSTDEKDDFLQTLTNIQYSRFINSKTDLAVTGYYNYLNGGLGVQYFPFLIKFSVRSNLAGLISNLKYESNGFKSITGILANTYRRDHFINIFPQMGDKPYLNTGYKKEFSAFEKMSYEYKNFTVYGDIQYRHTDFKYAPDANIPLSFNPVNWNFINPKFGVTYSLRTNNIIYASIGRTSREPTRNDMFAGYDNIDYTNYSEIGDFTRVKPETVTDIETGIKFVNSKVRFDGNIYLMYFKNEIAAIGQLSYVGLPLRKNVASSYRKGIEVSMEAKLGKVTSVTNANLSRNRIKEYTTDYDSVNYKNVRPLLTPEIIINQSFIYKVSKRIAIDVNGKYIAQSFLDNTNNSKFVTPESLIFGSALNIQVSKSISVNVVANNITNKKYYMSGYVQNNESYYFPMATRNYLVTLKVKL